MRARHHHLMIALLGAAVLSGCAFTGRPSGPLAQASPQTRLSCPDRLAYVQAADGEWVVSESFRDGALLAPEDLASKKEEFALDAGDPAQRAYDFRDYQGTGPVRKPSDGSSYLCVYNLYTNQCGPAGQRAMAPSLESVAQEMPTDAAPSVDRPHRQHIIRDRH